MAKCKLCKIAYELTTHHNYPVVHFGKRHNNDKTILCRSCHNRVENYILAIESFMGEVPFGKRVRLDYTHYKTIKGVLRL